MKFIFYLYVGLLFFSCIRKEPLNAEADITSCIILNAAGQPDPYIRGNTMITNNRVMAQADSRIDLTALALQLTLTEGATISPDPRKIRDYSIPQVFEVTAQDERWKKKYTVSIDTFDLPVKYDFEYFKLNENGLYEVFYELMPSRDTVVDLYIWASGNPGYALTGVAKTPEQYPTVAIVNGHSGHGVKLETKSTGGFGEIVKMPIAAGNLFIGSFYAANALREPLKATLFGLPFGKKPIRFTGYYKYKPGKQYTVVGDYGQAEPVPGKQDICDLYAVLYQSGGLEENSLNGADVLTSPNIIALARIKNPVVLSDNENILTAPYERFVIDFDYATYHEICPFDPEKAKNYEYNLAVVFTSSLEGAFFRGAVGSVLYIDEAEIICQ